MKTKLMLSLLLGTAWLASAAPFTNIYFPGSWPLAQWWTNSSLPSYIAASNAWQAENANWAMASNSFAASTDAGWVQSGTFNSARIPSLSAIYLPLHATADAAASGWPTTWTLSSATFANQGSVYNLLHGNASGNPTWSAIDLSHDVTGSLPYTAIGSPPWISANQTVTLSGDITGSGATAITTTLKNTGTAGTYTKVTHDAQGRETSGTSAALASADYANQGTTTALLHGNASGNPSWSQVNLAADVTGSLPYTAIGSPPWISANQTVTLSGDITGSGATAITTTLKNTGTAGTYTKVTLDAQGRETSGTSAALASADYANQGTTTTLLHGNASGNPSWSQVNLAADVTGSLPYTAIGSPPWISANQTITFSGDATGSGTTAVTLTVTNAHYPTNVFAQALQLGADYMLRTNANTIVTGFGTAPGTSTYYVSLTVTNYGGSDFTVTVPNSVYTPDGLRAWTVTNYTTQVGRREWTFKVSNNATSGVSRWTY